jgi:tetratricopeptide (TPR) repeat protein
LARIQLDQKNFAAAIPNLEAAHLIYQEIAAADAQDARSRSILATSHYRLGQAYTRLGDAKKGAKEIQTALEMREKLAETDPLNAGAQGEVAEAQAALGDAAASRNQNAAALGWYRRAQGILEKLKAEGRSNSASNDELARVNAAIQSLQ